MRRVELEWAAATDAGYRTDRAARAIQTAWRAYRNRRIYHYYRDLIRFRCGCWMLDGDKGRGLSARGRCSAMRAGPGTHITGMRLGQGVGYLLQRHRRTPQWQTAWGPAEREGKTVVSGYLYRRVLPCSLATPSIMRLPVFRTESQRAHEDVNRFFHMHGR